MLVIIYVIFLGLIIGSAINAFVWRLYVGRKWTKGRSICPACKHELAPKDLVPVMSWLWLRGKCRYCKAPIKDSPIVEAISAVIFGLSAVQLPHNTLWSVILLVVWLCLLTLLIILAVYDARWLILPNKIMYPAIGLAGTLMVLKAVSSGSLLSLRSPLVAALIAGAVFYAIVAGSGGRAMGGGDIKLVFLMGLVLGGSGTIIALLIAFDSAAIIALILIGLKLRGRHDQLPFGPYLVAGTILAYLYGPAIVNAYLRFNGLA